MTSNVKNAFTVDVEDYFHVSAYSSVIDRSDWRDLPSRVERNTDKMMSILDDSNTKGTFFVLGWVAQEFPTLIQRIASCGHEIACHGMSHRLVYAQGRDAFRKEAYESKEMLQEITGRPVNGYRAASFSITRASLWALEDLAELGFQYDSSVFPVHHDIYGIPSAPRTPFHYACQNGKSIVEFPMTTVSLFGCRLPVSGGGYFRIFPYAVTKAAYRHREKRRESSVFYTHPWEIDPDQPMINGGWLSNFRHRTNLGRSENRLRRLLSDFSFTSMNSVIQSSEWPTHSNIGSGV